MFQQVWLVQSVAYSRSDAMSHSRSGYGKDINFCLRCSGILFLTSSVGSCHVCGHSGSLWRDPLNKDRTEAADNHTSELGNGSFSPPESWDNCIPGQITPFLKVCWQHLHLMRDSVQTFQLSYSFIPDPQKLWDKFCFKLLWIGVICYGSIGNSSTDRWNNCKLE